jgi:hypothetical protein
MRMLGVLPEKPVVEKTVLVDSKKVNLKLKIVLVKDSHIKYFSFAYINEENGFYEPVSDINKNNIVLPINNYFYKYYRIIPLSLNEIIEESKKEKRRRLKIFSDSNVSTSFC